MNISILIANILTTLAFFAHTFIGDKELKIIEPGAETSNYLEKREKWTMARCGWHWISFDLLFSSIALSIINFSNYIKIEKEILQIFTLYFFCYSIFWLLTIIISKQFPKNYIKLGQWILLILISGLLYLGNNS